MNASSSSFLKKSRNLKHPLQQRLNFVAIHTLLCSINFGFLLGGDEVSASLSLRTAKKIIKIKQLDML